MRSDKRKRLIKKTQHKPNPYITWFWSCFPLGKISCKYHIWEVRKPGWTWGWRGYDQHEVQTSPTTRRRCPILQPPGSGDGWTHQGTEENKAALVTGVALAQRRDGSKMSCPKNGFYLSGENLTNYEELQDINCVLLFVENPQRTRAAHITHPSRSTLTCRTKRASSNWMAPQ